MLMAHSRYFVKTSLLVLTLALILSFSPTFAWATLEEDQTSLSDQEIADAIEDMSSELDQNELGSKYSAKSTRSSFFNIYAGETLFDTAAAQARAAYSASESAVIVGDAGWADALSATGLAGALDCPILFSGKDGLGNATASALRDLGVRKVVVVGGATMVSKGVLEELAAMGISSERVWGESYYDTQMEVYARGKGLWARDCVIVASGTYFADALSAAPIAFAEKAPVFLVDEGKDLSAVQKEALLSEASQGHFARAIVVGGETVVSDYARGFLDFTSQLAAASGGGQASCSRLSGETLYDTSSAVASWAAEQGILSWDNVAFTSSSGPYDALAGSVLQGKTGSVLLLVGDAHSSTIATAASHKGSISSVRFFGGRNVMPDSIKRYISYSMDFGYAPSGGFKLSDGTWIAANSAGIIPRAEAINHLMSTAHSLLGIPYVWGGVWPDDGGMDCSSLSLYCYGQIGVTLGDDTYTQVTQGKSVPFFAAQPGDLIFMYYWSAPTYTDRPEHVVIYAGNGMIYEEPNFGMVCQYVPLWTKNADRLVVRRYLAEY